MLWAWPVAGSCDGPALVERDGLGPGQPADAYSQAERVDDVNLTLREAPPRLMFRFGTETASCTTPAPEPGPLDGTGDPYAGPMIVWVTSAGL